MDETEYERRRRALEEIYQADLALVQAAHAARLRSLEALRTPMAAPQDTPTPAAAVSPPPPRPAPPSPAAVAGSPRPDLRQAVGEIFSQLPEVFDKKDVAHALGWTPNRSSLQRVLGELEEDGYLQFVEMSLGRTPSRYKKT